MKPPPSDAGVYANLKELAALEGLAHGFSFLPKQPVASLLSGSHGSRLRGRGLDFDEIRRYQPGDDIRLIDWLVTARTRKPHTRVFTEERERPVLLVVDQRITMFFGSQVQMKSVTAAEFAALAAWRTIRVKDRVGAIVFNDTQIREIRPFRSREHVTRLLRIVLEQNHALAVDRGIRSAPEMFNEALRRAQRLATHDFLVCLITDAHGSDDTTRALVTTIARHNDVLIAFIHDPLEKELPQQAKRLVVSDGARQLEFNAGKRTLQTGFSEEFGQRLEQARRFLLAREVPILPIQTSGDVAKQVVRLLGGSQRVRRT